jgi:hypothetical protein
VDAGLDYSARISEKNKKGNGLKRPLGNSGETLSNYRSIWGLVSVFFKFGQFFPQVMTKSCHRQVVCRLAHVCG